MNTKVFKNAMKCVYRLAFIKVYKSKKVWLREKKGENVHLPDYTKIQYGPQSSLVVSRRQEKRNNDRNDRRKHFVRKQRNHWRKRLPTEIR